MNHHASGATPGRRFGRRLTSGMLAVALTVAGLTGAGIPTATSAHAAENAVDNVQFRWGISNEANNAGFAPGTWNLFSAGRIGDPGEGGRTLVTADQGATWNNDEPAGWTNQEGNVTVEDLQPDDSYAPTTFDGTRQTKTGAAITPPTGPNFAETQVVIDGGTGTMDREANTANVSWDGDFTVILYSGMTFFYVSDPELTVNSDGTGTITATAGGYAANMDDLEDWEALDDTEVTLANLTGVEVTDTGFTVTPDYLGVEYDAPQGATAQNRTVANWGAFPQDFADFQQLTGQGPYWYSSGGAVDGNKPTLPLEIVVPPEFASPVVTASQTSFLPTGEHTLTITGQYFHPALSPAPANPAGLSTGGVYVALGRFADVWKPTASAPGAARTVLAQWWALPAADHPILGGQASSAIDLDESGSFTATFTAEKAELDEFAGNPDGNFGVYTFTRAPGVGPFETYTPITFAKAAPDVTIATPKASAGSDLPVTITVSGAVPVTGEVTLHDNGTAVGTATVTGGSASITLARPRAGARTLTASYTGDDNHEEATTTRSLVVSRAGTRTAVKVKRKPGPARKGRAVVAVRSPSGLPVTGKVTLVVKRGKKTVRKLSTTVKRSGRKRVALPRLTRGTYKVVVKFGGDTDHAMSKDTVRLRVTAR